MRLWFFNFIFYHCNEPSKSVIAHYRVVESEPELTGHVTMIKNRVGRGNFSIFLHSTARENSRPILRKNDCGGKM